MNPLELRLRAGLISAAAAALLFAACQREVAVPGSDTPEAFPGGQEAPSDRAGADLARNVVVITLDTTRADALGSYGQKLPSSPNLDRLAEEGTQFLQCLSSAPSTLPSHSTIFTGKQPYAHGARSNSGHVLSDANTTLAEVLSDHGYETGAEVAAAVLGSHTLLDQGFGQYRDAASPDVEHKRIVVGTEDIELPERDAADITQHAVRFIREHRKQKFFLWLHYFDPHAPHAAPARFSQLKQASRYHAEVRYADEQINRVIKEIEGLGLRERTLVVVTADHGEGRGEHAEDTHSYFVYDTTMRVPLLFWGADVPAGLKLDSFVRSVDIAPTILDWLDLPIPEDTQGASLLPLLRGGAPDVERVAYGETIEPYVVFGASILRYVREGRWKYIHKVEPELFDISRDPAELKNLAASHPEIVERLRKRLFELIGDAPSGPDDARTSIDPGTAEQLEALGYLAAAPTEPLDDEVALLELQGVDPTALTGDVRLLAEAAGFTKTKIFDKSAERYRVLVERHPDSVPLLTKLAASLEEIGADEERFALLSRLMALAPEEPGAYIGLAHLTFKRGDQPEAERLLLEALRVEPCSPGARATLAHLAATKGDHPGQIRLLKEGVDQCNIADGFLNSYAYALATSPDGADRDGQEALRISKEITSERDGERPDFLDTLAAAYAETGDFENAILSGKRAIALIEAEDQAGSLDEIMRHLALFEAGRPVRE